MSRYQTQSQAAVPDEVVSAPTPLEALALGWSIIPTNLEKRPMVPWSPYQRQHPTKEQVEIWDQTFQPASWALITGQISNRITIDFDGETGLRSYTALGMLARIGKRGFLIERRLEYGVV